MEVLTLNIPVWWNKLFLFFRLVFFGEDRIRNCFDLIGKACEREAGKECEGAVKHHPFVVGDIRRAADAEQASDDEEVEEDACYDADKGPEDVPPDPVAFEGVSSKVVVKAPDAVDTAADASRGTNIDQGADNAILYFHEISNGRDGAKDDQ